MKSLKSCAPLLAILFTFAHPAGAQQVELNIHYVLPENPDLAGDARRLEANALSQRNIEIQACANGNNSRLCEQNAEISFRLRIIPLGWATNKGSFETVQYLIEQGADVDAIQENFGFVKTALFTASHDGRADIVKVLLDNGASVNGRSSAITPLMTAADTGFADVVLLLLEYGASIDTVSLGGYGETAIQMARKNGHTDVLEILRKHGAKE